MRHPLARGKPGLLQTEQMGWHGLPWPAYTYLAVLCSTRVRFGGVSRGSDHGSAAKTLIAHRGNTASYAG